MFGENLLWGGLALVCAGGRISPALCLVSPVWSVFFLVFTSLSTFPFLFAPPRVSLRCVCLPTRARR